MGYHPIRTPGLTKTTLPLACEVLQEPAPGLHKEKKERGTKRHFQEIVFTKINPYALLFI
jgi:hypothetical protein